MPPQSRGNAPVPPGFQSRSTPNLPTLSSLRITTSMKPTNGAEETATPSTARQHTSAAAAEAARTNETSLRSQSPPITSPSEPASIEDNNEEDENGDDAPEMFTLDASTSSDEDALTRPVDDEEDEQHQRRRSLPTSRSYTHLPHPAHPSSLYPPFYNRPPTPLPPSPSLTSLLRPPFSTHPSSRPTTPDSSDIEYNSAATATTTTTNGGAAAANPNLALSKSARLAPTSVPRASPKVPTYEYYGFALYLASSVAFLMYCLWAFLPSPFLHRLGIHYYLNRWWALATPAWLVMLVVYIYAALASYNTQYLTLPMQSCENLVDEAGVVACVDRETGRIIKPMRRGGLRGGTEGRGGGRGGIGAGSVRGKAIEAVREPETRFSAGENVNFKALWSIGTDGVMDIPIGGVCEILYGGASSDVEME